MAVIETLLHPFAAAKIVVWPATCSVRGGLIIAARSRDACGDATLRACRRRGERTSDCCDRDEGGRCLLHSRTLLQMTPSVSTRWMHGKLLVAQTIAAAINLQILSFDETDTRSSSKKTNVGDAAIFSEGSLCRGDRWDPLPVRGWRAATRPPHHPRHQQIPPPAGHRIRSTECIDRGWLRVACCKVLMSVVGPVTSGGRDPREKSPVYPDKQTV